MAGFLITLLVAAGLIALLIYVMGSKDRYSSMTEEEFEQESRKKTLIGAALVGFEAAWRRKEAEIVMEAKNRVEHHATPSPGEPPEETTKNSEDKNEH